MRIAYADPPYPGQADRHYAGHPDYNGEVDHEDLIASLIDFDGWALSTHTSGLLECQSHLLELGLVCNRDYRLMAWVKPFAAYKRNITVAYSWEPVIVAAARPAEPNRIAGVVCRDHLAEPITLKRGLVGAKPERFCYWLFEVLGLELDDDFIDLYPGSGAVTDALATWRRALGQIRFAV